MTGSVLTIGSFMILLTIGFFMFLDMMEDFVFPLVLKLAPWTKSAENRISGWGSGGGTTDL
jgi:hypothetical protein